LSRANPNAFCWLKMYRRLSHYNAIESKPKLVDTRSQNVEGVCSNCSVNTVVNAPYY
jgi:hypothetical protein